MKRRETGGKRGAASYSPLLAARVTSVPLREHTDALSGTQRELAGHATTVTEETAHGSNSG